MTGERRTPGERRDKDLRGPSRRATDARGGRPTRRAFRPLRWAWLLLLVALLAPAYDLFLPAGYRPQRERRTVVIERGQSLHEIAQELQRVGVIRSQVGFLVLARAMQLDRSVKAGQYSFRLGMTVPALLRALDRGMFGLNLVTIPEGLMVSETAALIERKVGISATAIDSLARDPFLLDLLEIAAPSLEGWLAPDSYEWLPGTSPEVVLRTMVARTRERVQRATAGYDSLPLGMNAHEVLTLASIVESESRAKEERPHIARVYLNRLERGMLLQADPTVGYALGRGPRSRLTFKDLRVQSPYNTYRHEGLPPGPICSPGEEAIAGVMNATIGVNDLYFVARGQGRHMFAPTYEQHLANIAYVRGKKAAMEARDNPEAASDAEPDSSTATRTAPAPLLAGGTPNAPKGSVPTSPVSTSPVPTSPVPTSPVPTSPVPTSPVPTSPVPTSPVPTSPALKLPGARLTPAPAGARAGAAVTPSTTAARPSASAVAGKGTAASSKAAPGGLLAAPLAAPLKGTLLIPHGGIKAASTPPPSETVVPSKAGHAAAADSGRGATAKPAAPKPAAPKPAAPKPAAPKTAVGSPAPAARPAAADTTHVRRKVSATAAPGDTARKAAAATSGSAPAAKPAAKAPAKPTAESTAGGN